MAAPLNVLIFAKDLPEARAFAAREGLESRGRFWKMARSLDADRYHVGPVAILPGFPENPLHDLLEPLADLLEHENGPYVPTTATAGRTIA